MKLYPPKNVCDVLENICNDLETNESIRRVLADAFVGMMQHLPPALFSEEPQECIGPVVPLHDVLDNCGQAITDFCLPILYDEELVAKGYLSAERRQLFENEASMNGLTLYGRRSKAVPAPQERKEDPHELVFLYFKDTPFLDLFNAQVPFVISKKALSEHCFICAKPGHGKTVLLSSFAAQFLQDPNQPGLFCLDPAGDWFEKLRDRVPPERLVVLDPETNPPPLNFFDFKNSTEAAAQQSFTYLMTSLAGGLSEKQSALVPFLLKLIRIVPEASLETLRLIVDEKVKSAEKSAFAQFIAKLPTVDQEFFRNQFYQQSMSITKEAISWKIYAAMGSDAFRKMFGAAENSFDAHAAMRDRKVVLARGSELTLGEAGLPIFLQYVVSQFFLAALARFRIPEHQRHQCYLLCDEASHIFNHQITRILVECRKLGLSFFGATQVLDQIPPEVKASIYGATSIKAAGNVSFSDANLLAREMRTKSEFIQGMKTFEWAFFIADNDKAMKVVVRPGMLEALPTHRHSGEMVQPRNDDQSIIATQVPLANLEVAQEVQRFEANIPRRKTTPKRAPPPINSLDANGRIDKALRLLAAAVEPVIEKELTRIYGGEWRQHISVAEGADLNEPLDPYAALKSMLDNWQSCFKNIFTTDTRYAVSKAFQGRNKLAHTSREIPPADAISYLTAIRDIALATSATSVIDVVNAFIDDQLKSAVGIIVAHEGPSKPELSDTNEPLLKPGKEW